jgi:ABC-type transport system involved in multi-copper enzyme maturation permease subunit
MCLEVVIRHAFLVGSERAISHRRNERLSMFDNNGSFLLALFEFFLFFAWFMCLWWILGDIFRSKDIGGVAKTLWVLFVIIIPWLGILIYVIARGHGMQERQLEQVKAMQHAQNEYVRSVAGSSKSAADEIASAKGLLDSGAITQAEFDQLKARVLAA